jgi:iron complex transport system substrate-binding protein
MDGLSIQIRFDKMNKKLTYAIAILAIVSSVIAVFTLITYQGEPDEFKGADLVDDMGYSLTLTSPPKTIVSLAPSNTEILFAIGAGDKVVGVTKYCNYPHNFTAWIEADNMTSIGSYYNPTTEPIVALEPDLILSTQNSLDCTENLRNLGYNVLVLAPKNVSDVLDNILLVGRATDHYNEAVTIESELRQRIDAIANQTAAATSTPKVYNEIWAEPPKAAGPETFIDELITLAGGKNIFHDAIANYPAVSNEEIIAKNPDVIVFPDEYMGRAEFSETMEDVKNRPGWETISAVQSDRIYEINSDLISRAGPRLADALEILAKMVHPEIFGQP